jgi:leucyl aminopeptidase
MLWNALLQGVTFDTGGLNLKPTGSMETMHFDMAGSAAVLGAMHVIAKQRMPRNVGAL